MKDELVRAMTKDGFVNAVAVTTTGIVERARQIHKTLPTATAALGRLLTAARTPIIPAFPLCSTSTRAPARG